jgi:hypothetical protein
MSPVEGALLDCFDEDHERRIVRRLIRRFEKRLAEDTLGLMKEREGLIDKIRELETERGFWQAQFEQAETRIQRLQGSL